MRAAAPQPARAGHGQQATSGLSASRPSPCTGRRTRKLRQCGLPPPATPPSKLNIMPNFLDHSLRTGSPVMPADMHIAYAQTGRPHKIVKLSCSKASSFAYADANLYRRRRRRRRALFVVVARVGPRLCVAHCALRALHGSISQEQIRMMSECAPTDDTRTIKFATCTGIIRWAASSGYPRPQGGSYTRATHAVRFRTNYPRFYL